MSDDAVGVVESAIKAECERQMDCERGDEVHDHWGDIARAALNGLKVAGYVRMEPVTDTRQPW